MSLRNSTCPACGARTVIEDTRPTNYCIACGTALGHVPPEPDAPPPWRADPWVEPDPDDDALYDSTPYRGTPRDDIPFGDTPVDDWRSFLDRSRRPTGPDAPNRSRSIPRPTAPRDHDRATPPPPSATDPAKALLEAARAKFGRGDPYHALALLEASRQCAPADARHRLTLLVLEVHIRGFSFLLARAEDTPLPPLYITVDTDVLLFFRRRMRHLFALRDEALPILREAFLIGELDTSLQKDLLRELAVHEAHYLFDRFRRADMREDRMHGSIPKADLLPLRRGYHRLDRALLPDGMALALRDAILEALLEHHPALHRELVPFLGAPDDMDDPDDW